MNSWAGGGWQGVDAGVNWPVIPFVNVKFHEHENESFDPRRSRLTGRGGGDPSFGALPADGCSCRIDPPGDTGGVQRTDSQDDHSRQAEYGCVDIGG